MSGEASGDILPLPAGLGPPSLSAEESALEELEYVFAFIHARVGNRPDAEDLVQQVALKAIPRLHATASRPSVRAYLFATARTCLAEFWAARFGVPIETLAEDLWLPTEQPAPAGDAADRVERILDRLPSNYRRVLELRFLRGYSLKEAAGELGNTVGGIKVMQLRALRAAARLSSDEAPE